MHICRAGCVCFDYMLQNYVKYACKVQDCQPMSIICAVWHATAAMETSTAGGKLAEFASYIHAY